MLTRSRRRDAAVVLATAMLTVPLDGSPLATSPRTGAAVRADTIHAYLDGLAAFGFTGSVLVATDGGILLERGYGAADRTRGIPFTPETVVDIGSVTKTFTRVAIAQLAQRRRLRFDEPLRAVFPEAPADKADVTIRQLLDHTGGFGLYVAPDAERLSDADFLRRLFAAPLVARPGTAEHYSNPGYSLLAAIVERRSGLSYDRYLERHVLRPAGMRTTGYVLPAWRDGQLAVNYQDGEARPSTFEYPHWPDGPSWTLRGNGGLLSTVGDMYRFHLALHDGRLLPPGAELPFASGQAYTMVGADGVHYFVYEHDPARRLTILAASTDAGWRATEVAARIGAIARGEPVTMPPAIRRLEAGALARFAGTHRLDSGAELTLAVRDGALVASGVNEAGFRALAGDAGPATGDGAALGERAQAIMAAAGNGDHQPLHAALHAAIPLAQFSANQTAAWRRRVEALGGFRGATALTTTTGQGGRTTIVKLEFQRGAQYAYCIWGRNGLMAFSISPAAPAAVFHPRSETEFVSFDLRRGRTLRLRATGTTPALQLTIEPDAGAGPTIIRG